jgi:pimeloyl-ACP methyl ester carboxylesterase
MRLAHDISGSGPRLLLIHGIGHRRQAFDPVVPALAAHRQVVTVDLPGFGASPPLPPGATCDVAALAAAVAAFATQELGLERFHVAGNSLGGGITLELARAGVARTATAISPIGFWTAAEREYAVASLYATRALCRLTAPIAPRLLARRRVRTAMIAQMVSRQSRVAPAIALADLRGVAAAPGFERTLREIRRYDFTRPEELRVPVTIAWGTRDRLLLPTQAVRARRLLPGARHVRLERAGHIPMPEDPEAVARVLLQGSS